MKLRTFNGLLAAVAVILAGLPGCKKQDDAFEVLPQQASKQLQRYWPLPDFSLIERSGKTINLSDLRGKVWVADFFYTSCPGPCPMMTSRLSQIHKTTRALPDVLLVSISTDPLKDTPTVLGEYAQKFGADDKWLFLTGEKDTIFTLANKGFKLGVTEDPAGGKEPITHSTKLALVDKNSIVRGFYDSANPAEAARLTGDIERLLKESR
jgi:protein SCO1/2